MKQESNRRQEEEKKTHDIGYTSTTKGQLGVQHIHSHMSLMLVHVSPGKRVHGSTRHDEKLGTPVCRVVKNIPLDYLQVPKSYENKDEPPGRKTDVFVDKVNGLQQSVHIIDTNVATLPRDEPGAESTIRN